MKQLAPTLAPTPQPRGLVLQRQCACGNHTHGEGECESCKMKRETGEAHEVTVQRKPVAAPSPAPPKLVRDFSALPSRQMGAAMPMSMPILQAKLRMNAPNDAYEREADDVAVRILRTSEPASADGARLSPVTGHIAQRAADDEAKQQPAAQQDAVGNVAPAIDDNTDDSADEDDIEDDASEASEEEPMEEQAVQAKRISHAAYNEAPDQVSRYVASLDGGQPLPAGTRSFMEPRFGHDFSGVRVHADSTAHQHAAQAQARAFTTGQHIVFGAGEYQPESADGRQLLAHELTHVVQQGAARPGAIQRKVVLKGKTLTAKDRKAFLKAHASKWRSRTQAKVIMEDMASAIDKFDFADDAELEREIVKRAATVRRMTQSQQSVGSQGTAFGYPFSGASLLYGPRVNYAAREYWTPAVVDSYARRTDKVKNAELRKLPRNKRCQVYGDPCGGYEWKLTDKGKAEPYKAIVKLFEPQSAHKRSLLHCDYLISLVNFRSLADAIGEAEFNKRVKAFGPEKIILRWNAFADLHIDTFRKDNAGHDVKIAGIGSTQSVRPSSEADLIIGDHVVFWNAPAYNVINRKIGNAWRLENAVLIEKNDKGKDVFLGHGSGRKTSDEMNRKLVEEFNIVAKIALDLTRRADSSNAKTSSDAQAELADRFPGVQKMGVEWRIKGMFRDCNQPVDVKLREITPADMTGLKDPCDPSKMNWVERPSESAP